jgi:hypothetical protein
MPVSGPVSHELSLLTKLVMAGLVLLFLAGVALNGISLEEFERIWRQLINRPGHPMAFRFIIQPLMGGVMAFLHGRVDARVGRLPYFWNILSNPPERGARLRGGANATARVILLGAVMDTIYQIIVLKSYYPAEAAIVGLLLGYVPYIVLRGTVTRVLRAWRAERSTRRSS